MSRAAITSALLGVGAIAFTCAIALPFDDRVEFRANNRIDTKPAWLVPQKSEFLGLQRGYGGLKILAAIAGTTAMGGVMVLARSQAAREPVRQRIQGYRNQAEEFSAAAESAYQMALVQQRYKTLLEADQVAFEGEVENAYLESMGVDPNQKALPGTTLEQVTNPGDKVREAEVTPAIAPDDTTSPTPSTPASPSFPTLTNYPSVLIFGAQGSGKTTFAETEIQRRLNAGHKVLALDPHAKYGGWKGCEVVGAGMAYEDIDRKLGWFASEVKRRYELIAKQPDPKFQPLTIVCDEFTNWAGRCENSGDFFQAAVSDIRKAEMFVLIVSHTRTLAGLGDAKGMAKLRDEALLEIELLGQLDPSTGRAVPRFEALIKLPGQGQGDRQLIKIPRSQPPRDPREFDPEYFERTYRMEFDLRQPDTIEPDSPAEPDMSEQPESLSNKESEVVWSVGKVQEFYPDSSPERLFEDVCLSARLGTNARDIIKTVLKCYAGSDHPTRSYSRHGKSLLRWLIENYDDGAIASLPAIKKFLEDAA